MKERRGFSLLEVLISTAISLVRDADRLPARSRRANELASDRCARRLAAAGASGGRHALAVAARSRRAVRRPASAYGPLSRHLPAVLPRRIGARGADRSTSSGGDAFTAIRVVADTTHAALSLPLASGSTPIELATVPGCAVPDVRLRRRLDRDADRSRRLRTTSSPSRSARGASLTVRVLAVPAAAARTASAHRCSRSIPPRSSSLRLSVLHRYDGDASDVPAIDDVVAIEVRYYGATQPPVWPRPPAGEANCLYDAAGSYQSALMPTL